MIKQIGVIADTHGLLRPEAKAALKTSDVIFHDLKSLDFDPESAGISVVVSGHSHQANIREQNNVLYINPGGAGPKRFKFPIGIGR